LLLDLPCWSLGEAGWLPQGEIDLPALWTTGLGKPAAFESLGKLFSAKIGLLANGWIQENLGFLNICITRYTILPCPLWGRLCFCARLVFGIGFEVLSESAQPVSVFTSGRPPMAACLWGRSLSFYSFWGSSAN